MNQSYKKLVVMNRSDGTGSRLFAIINAMAIADKLSSIDNMRFLWNETRFKDKSIALLTPPVVKINSSLSTQDGLNCLKKETKEIKQDLIIIAPPNPALKTN